MCQNQTNKYNRNPQDQKFLMTPTPSIPFEIIHSDSFQAQGQKFLTIIDTISKYGQAYAITTLSGIEVVKSFLIFSTHHGLPHLVIERGTKLKNTIVLCRETLGGSTPYTHSEYQMNCG